MFSYKWVKLFQSICADHVSWNVGSNVMTHNFNIDQQQRLPNFTPMTEQSVTFLQTTISL